MQHAEIFSHHEKFLKPISWTFQKLWISNVVSKNEFWQRWQKFLGCKKIFSSCKNFCMMLQKSLFAAQKDRAPSSSGGADEIFIIPLSCLTTFVSEVFWFGETWILTPGAPPSPLGVRGQIWIAYSVLWYMKVKPYQFGLATISGFWDHSSVPRLRTNQNQLVNIYLIEGNNHTKMLKMIYELSIDCF